MKVHNDPIVGLMMMAGFGVIYFIIYLMKEAGLEDPTNDRLIYLHQLREKASLSGTGQWSVVIYRQSGNVHASYVVSGSSDDAINQVIATFQRAKIDTVGVLRDSPDFLQVRRLYDNARRNSGKRVGSATIRRI